MEKTLRLFDQDSFIRTFTAIVLSCEPLSGPLRDLFADYLKKHPEAAAGQEGNHEEASERPSLWCVILDRTAFFPEGGGQDSDTGTLIPRQADDAISEGISILDVQEKDGVICHLAAAPVPEGTEVSGCICWPLRFDRMQQHSGEHLFSGLVHSLYGYNNVGFHLGDDVTTLDFSGPLTKEQAKDIEDRVNEAIFADIPVRVFYPAQEELSSLPYRSKIEIEGQVRLVEFPGYDLCACCAPHVHSTGQIGLLKVVHVMSHRGGVRISILCGKRALADYSEKQEQVKEISVLLSAKETAVADAVRRLGDEIYSLRGELMQLRQARLDRELEQLPEDSRDVLYILEALPTDAVREFVNRLMERCTGICCAFYGDEKNGFQYIIGSRSTDLRPFCKEMNAALSGRGGGRPEMVQGSVKAGADAIRAWMDSYMN